jgi:hypothetical protein
VNEQHALPGEPDAAVASRKMDQPTQVGVARQGRECADGHAWILDKKLFSIRRRLNPAMACTSSFHHIYRMQYDDFIRLLALNVGRFP